VRLVLLVLGAVLSVLLAACQFRAETRPLPADAAWRGVCGLGVGRDAVLQGAYSAPPVTWATDGSSGARFELLWPWGYQAQFAPRLEVLGEGGTVVAREGDLIIGSCGLPADDARWRVSAGDVRPPTWQPGDG
jgi:hypothetical protein